MNVQRLKKSIKKHEGLRLKPYKCTAGKLTIGYGRNLEDNGISEDEAEYLLQRDISSIHQLLDLELEIFRFPSHVQEVLTEMSFQLGVHGLLKFRKTIQFVKEGSYIKASQEMLDSKWAKQTPKRAQTLSKKMRGEF